MEGNGRFWRNWRGLNEEGRVEQERVLRPNLDFFSHLWSPNLSITPQRQMWHGSQGELFWRKRTIGEGREHLEGSCGANVNKILWCLHTTMSQWSLLFCMQTKEAYRRKTYEQHPYNVKNMYILVGKIVARVPSYYQGSAICMPVGVGAVLILSL